MSLRKRLSLKNSLRKLLNWQPADEYRLRLAERKLFFAEARRKFVTEKPQHGSFRDYKRAFRRHRVTYAEYMYSYEFWRLDEAKRNHFLSTSEAQCIYRKAGDAKVRLVFKNKALFLNTFSDFVTRDWISSEELPFETFLQFIKRHEGIILKPNEGTRGKGIEKIHYQGDEEAEAIYRRVMQNRCILEECITACEEISAFHPQSLNTIRVVTVSGKGKCELFGALIRMGAGGSFVDNTHAGGIYAPIDIATGTVMTDGMDAHNRHFPKHPDTGKPIKGFIVPHWLDIVETCRRASQHIPNIRFAGWDLCVLPNGKVEIIEGNHAPDFDGGMQAPLKTGVKFRFQQTVKEVLGFDPLPLISIFHKTKKQG